MATETDRQGNDRRTLVLETVDFAAMVVLAAVMTWEVLHPAERSHSIDVLNRVLFGVFVALFIARIATGEWKRLSLPWKAAEVLLLAAAVPIRELAVGPIRLLRLMRLPLVGARRARSVRQQLIDRGALLVTSSVVAIAYIGSLFILEFEKGKGDGKLEDLPSALWWAATTMTTVGYGDIAPHTRPGRITAVCLMVIGIALFGLVTALLSKWLIGVRADDEPATKGDVAALRDEVVRLRAELAERR